MEEDKKGKKKVGKKKSFYKKGGEAYIGKEWDSDESSSDSNNEEVATPVFNKSAFFPKDDHTCPMAKESKTTSVLEYLSPVSSFLN
jgi:hypothetical protein